MQNFTDKVLGKPEKLKPTATWPFPVYTPPEHKRMEDELELPNVLHIFDMFTPGGLTIAWQKASPHKNCRMIKLAVQVCSQYDAFNKKVGRKGALEKFKNGETISLPLRLGKTDETIIPMLKATFTMY